MSIAQNLVNNIIRWKALPLQSLFALEETSDNYKSFITTSHRLKRQGLIDTVLMGTPTGDKIAFPTEKLLKEYKDEGTLKIYEKQLTHDALVSLFCLGMMKLDSFIDADIDDRLYGINRFKNSREYYPDAELVGRKKKTLIQVAVELELTQKSHARIKTKFQRYVDSGFYRKVIFAFTNKRLMEHYYNILSAYYPKADFPDIHKRIVFTFAKTSDLIEMDVTNLDAIHDTEIKKLDEINYYPGVFF